MIPRPIRRRTVMVHTPSRVAASLDWCLGLEGYHLSNADLAAHNPGQGSLLLVPTIPLGGT